MSSNKMVVSTFVVISSSTEVCKAILQTTINATTLALVDAGIALYDYVAAISAGLHSTSVLLDLTQHEEADIPNLTIAVMPQSAKVTLLSMESRLHATRLEDMLQVAIQASQIIKGEMAFALKSQATVLAACQAISLADDNNK